MGVHSGTGARRGASHAAARFAAAADSLEGSRVYRWLLSLRPGAPLLQSPLREVPASSRNPGMTAKRYLISGQVQGVGYRFFAVRMAQRLGIAGFVRNLRDGRVEVYAIGDAGQHEDLRLALERGPNAARVSSVIEQDAEIVPRYSDGFAIEEE